MHFRGERDAPAMAKQAGGGAATRTITLDRGHSRNYEPAFRTAIAQQPDDDYRVVMEFLIDGEVSETWTWTPAMTGYVEQNADGAVSRLQITWARKTAVAMIKLWRDGSSGDWVVRWSTASGEVQDTVLHATDPATAEEEAEGFIYRMAYL